MRSCDFRLRFFHTTLSAHNRRSDGQIQSISK